MVRVALAAALLLGLPALAQTTVLTFSGTVPDDGKLYHWVDFQVPAGIREVEVRHDDLRGTTGNILDFGVDAPDRVRGWGGGNTQPAIIAETAASRSYLPGPITPGTWRVSIGSAKLNTRPAPYAIEVQLKTTQTLAPQPQRQPYVHAAALKSGRQFYAGDFHVHSRESGDARPQIDEVATFARTQGLDFVVLTDHNTVSQADFIVDAQSRHPALLLIPGIEFTTYAGHANALGATRYVDHRIEDDDREAITAAASAFAQMGVIFSVNHPKVDLGDRCIGCAWRQPLPEEWIGGVEIGTRGWKEAGFLYDEPAIEFWDTLVANGFTVAALGGSDDHEAGQSTSLIDSRIGSPTTLVLAEELSAPAILKAVREGRTVVKLQDGADPMVDLRAGDARLGDTTALAEVQLVATVTGGVGHQVRLVHNGVPLPPQAITTDPFTLTHLATAPQLIRPDRYRAEVLVDGKPRTVTSHLFVGKAPLTPPTQPQGCGCTSATGSATLAALTLLALRGARQRPRKRSHSDLQLPTSNRP